ncbi:protoporphyrinogen/coproporphyrinogen oxidase, partial [Actinotalea ferrariae]|uniref:protoporphyrinogen/coproporphyrinogen oxidase n=1 Tax=Actinotalea ferrariae TaxID=1386098 RepID=UPI0005534DBB
AAAPAGSAVAGLRGGMHRLVEALVADVTARGVRLRTEVEVATVARGDDAWRVTLSPAVADGALDGPSVVVAPQVVLAVPGPVALRLLGDTLPGDTLLGEAPLGDGVLAERPLGDGAPEATALAGALDDGVDTGVQIVTLVLEAPALDAAPRGTGVLVAPEATGVSAKALTHATAKWAWLAEAAGPGRHVVRLSYGGARHARTLDEDAPLATALADASTLLGVRLGADQVVGWTRTPWPAGLPQVRPGHRDRVAGVRRTLEQHPGLDACGAWLAGTGLVAVVADARALAARL